MIEQASPSPQRERNDLFDHHWLIEEVNSTAMDNSGDIAAMHFGKFSEYLLILPVV